MGDEVYARLPGSRCHYDHGVVKEVSDIRTYEIQFEDGTICGDLSSNDIIVSYSSMLLEFQLELVFCYLLVSGRTSAGLCCAGEVEQEADIQRPYHWVLLCATIHSEASSGGEPPLLTLVPPPQVLFDNQLENTVSEENIYSTSEQLPRKIRDKLKVTSSSELLEL